MLSLFINRCAKKPSSSDQKSNTTGTGGGKKKMKEEEGVQIRDGGEEEEEQQRKSRSPSPSNCCPSSPNCLGRTNTTMSADHHRRRRRHSRQASINSRDSKLSGDKLTTVTTTRTSRSNFAKSTTSTLFLGTEFTNHESLPSLADALSSFTQTYPHFKDTQRVDRIRLRHYPHLSHHVCLDYAGFGLFSHSQLQSHHSPHFFDVSCKAAASLTSQVNYGNPAAETGLESAIRNRILTFLNLSPEDYSLVFTANRTSALKLLADTYPFHSHKRLLTVFDHESEAASAMTETAQKRGAEPMSANFSWPSLRIHSASLKKALGYSSSSSSKKEEIKKRSRGLFVFPLQSRMTGARYPYLWMRMAQESGWHVLLDACALGPKDLDTLGLSLIQPDFLVCSFFKVVGEVPSGFAALLVKKSSASSHLLGTTSAVSRGIGAIRIIPAATLLRSQLTDDFSGTFSENDTAANLFLAPPLSGQICNSTRDASKKHYSVMGAKTSETCQTLLSALSDDDDQNEVVEIVEAGKMRSAKADAGIFECMGLDHADSLGLLLISSRLRYITNWLVMALTKLRHPNSSSEANGHPLVRTYGPRIKFERGPAISFNVFDWKGEKVEPALVQKLADRSNISLVCGFLHNIWFSDKYEQERDGVLETRRRSVCHQTNKKIKDHEGNIDLGIAVVNASLGFLANFEDAYKLWSFIARFLDADFVEKERWRYMALNQKMIEKNIYIQHGFINLRVKSRCVLPTIITIAFYRDSSKLCLLFNHIEYIFTYMGKLMLVCPSKIGVTPSPQSSSLLQSSSIYKLKSYRRTEFEAYQYRFELEARVFLYWHVYMYMCGWKVWADRRTGSR